MEEELFAAEELEIGVLHPAGAEHSWSFNSSCGDLSPVNCVPSVHMQWRITASFRATATFAFLGRCAWQAEPPRLDGEFAHNHEQDICGLKQVIAGQPVTAFGDPAGPVQFPD